MSVESSSRILAAGTVFVVDAGEIVIGQPTALFVSGSGFEVAPQSAIGSAVLTLEEEVDPAEVSFVGTVSHPTERRVLSVDHTSDLVKTLRLLTAAGGADGGTINFLAIRV